MNSIPYNPRDDFESEGRKHVALVDDPACLRQVMRRRPSSATSLDPTVPAAAAPTSDLPLPEAKEIWIKMLMYKPLRSMRKCPSGKTNQERIFILDDTVKVVANFDPAVYTGNVWFIVEKGKTKKSKLWKRRWSELVQSLQMPSERVVYERFDVLEHGEVRQNTKAHTSPAIVPHIFCNLVRLCQDGEIWFQSDMFPTSRKEMQMAITSSIASSMASEIVPCDVTIDDVMLPQSSTLSPTKAVAAASSIPQTQNSCRPLPTPLNSANLTGVVGPLCPSGEKTMGYSAIPHFSLTSSPLGTPHGIKPAATAGVGSTFMIEKVKNPLLNAQVFEDNEEDNDDDDENENENENENDEEEVENEENAGENEMANNGNGSTEEFESDDSEVCEKIDNTINGGVVFNSMSGMNGDVKSEFELSNNCISSINKMDRNVNMCSRNCVYCAAEEENDGKYANFDYDLMYDSEMSAMMFNLDATSDQYYDHYPSAGITDMNANPIDMSSSISTNYNCNISNDIPEHHHFHNQNQSQNQNQAVPSTINPPVPMVQPQQSFSRSGKAYYPQNCSCDVQDSRKAIAPTAPFGNACQGEFSANEGSAGFMSTPSSCQPQNPVPQASSYVHSQYRQFGECRHKPQVPDTPFKSFIPLNPGAYYQEDKSFPYSWAPIDDIYPTIF